MATIFNELNENGPAKFATILNQLGKKGIDNFATIFYVLNEKGILSFATIFHCIPDENDFLKFVKILSELNENGPANFATILNQLDGEGPAPANFLKILIELNENGPANFATILNKLNGNGPANFAKILHGLDDRGLTNLVAAFNFKNFRLVEFTERINSLKSEEDVNEFVNNINNYYFFLSDFIPEENFHDNEKYHKVLNNEKDIEDKDFKIETEHKSFYKEGGSFEDDLDKSIEKNKENKKNNYNLEDLINNTYDWGKVIYL